MGGSLQDQLLKAGLVDEQRAKDLRHSKRKQQKQQGKRKGPGESEAQKRARAEQARKAERDRELNQRRREEAARKALVAQIKQLISDNRLPKNDSDIAYNFADGAKVKRVYVSEAVQTQLGNGSAAIVKLHGQYDVVPAAVAEKIAERDADCVIVFNRPDQNTDQDDPYADFQVPDDLMW